MKKTFEGTVVWALDKYYLDGIELSDEEDWFGDIIQKKVRLTVEVIEDDRLEMDKLERE
jgi:hypothetical protein